MKSTERFLESNWCGLQWSSWVAFDAPGSVYRDLATQPGLYRVRVSGRAELAYIGQTGRSIRERFLALRRGTLAEDMPFNDPHTAAPNLWAYRIEDGFEFECSAAIINLSSQNRRGLEDMLLWRHRIESGKSTLCN